MAKNPAQLRGEPVADPGCRSDDAAAQELPRPPTGWRRSRPCAAGRGAAGQGADDLGGGARQLRDAGLELGAHTVDHPILAKLNERRAGEPDRRLARPHRGGAWRKPRTFAMPNGSARDYDAATLQVLQRLGCWPPAPPGAAPTPTAATSTSCAGSGWAATRWRCSTRGFPVSSTKVCAAFFPGGGDGSLYPAFRKNRFPLLDLANGSSIAKKLELLLASEHVGRGEILRRQEENVARVVESTRRRSDFYRKHWQKGGGPRSEFAPLDGLPVVTKNDFADAAGAFPLPDTKGKVLSFADQRLDRPADGFPPHDGAGQLVLGPAFPHLALGRLPPGRPVPDDQPQSAARLQKSCRTASSAAPTSPSTPTTRIRSGSPQPCGGAA